MTKLLKNRVVSGLTQAETETYGLDLLTSRTKFVATPIVDDDEAKTWEKVGPVKRAEAAASLKVLRPYAAELPAHLSLPVADNGFSVFDNADAMIAFHEAAVADLKRLKTIGGATGLNMIKCVEEHIYLQADQDREWAIAARNLIEKLPRSSDKKMGGNNDKSGKGDTPPPK